MEWYPILLVLGIQLGFFLVAALFRTDTLTDLSYGLTFVAVAAWASSQSMLPYVWILSAMIIAWGVRLALYLFVRILRMRRDERFDGIRESIGRFAAFWFFQAVTIIVVVSPLFGVLYAQSGPLPTVSLAGLLVWLLGFVLETVADYQKYMFKRRHPGRLVDEGLFRYARHPNYLGEMLCWWGVFVYAAPFLGGYYWLTAASPVLITFLLLYGSGIPLLERRHEERYGREYERYRRATRLLVPVPRRGRS